MFFNIISDILLAFKIFLDYYLQKTKVVRDIF